MKLCFFAYGDNENIRRMAEMMVRSARRHMPGLPIIQATDADSAQYDFVDGVQRVNSILADPPALMLAKHYAMLDEETIFLDADIIVRADLREVFSAEFDVALCERSLGDRMKLQQRFLGGVEWFRNPTFGAAVYQEVSQMGFGEQFWYGVQIAFHKLYHSHRFNILSMPCRHWNYAPKMPQGEHQPIPDDVRAVHYKGSRKNWMLRDAHGLMA